MSWPISTILLLGLLCACVLALVHLYLSIRYRIRAEKMLEFSCEEFKQIFQTTANGMRVVSKNFTVLRVNKSFSTLAGIDMNQILGRKCYEVLPGNLCHTSGCPLTRILAGEEYVETDAKKRRSDGTTISCIVTATPFHGPCHEVAGIIEDFKDITDRKRAEESLLAANEKLASTFEELESTREELEHRLGELKYLNMHDPLTGLYNRAYFEEEIRRLEGGRRHPVGIILCDVDGLKLVNDTLGHEKGDKLLLNAAQIIRMSFREGDMVARIGGDEFAVTLPYSPRHVVESACGRIREAIDRYNTSNPELLLSISLGFAVSDVIKAKSIGDLFKEADNNMSREKLHRRQSARSAIVNTLMKALEARDYITEGHGDRLQVLVANMARAIGLSEPDIADLRLLAQFHDIGKVGIPDRILFKPGCLTLEEFIEMKRHSEVGYRIALSAPDLAPIADWILMHHEWWNGGGYPLGLSKENIPLACRILAIADAFDAMTSDRPYRKALSHNQAIDELKKYSGTQFDPCLVPSFIQMIEEIASMEDTK
jgi:diguanylate cyclase (GGDEF)-like protein/PAS domain S-box-containing protein